MSRVHDLIDALEQSSGLDFLFEVAPTAKAEMKIEAELVPALLQVINEATRQTGSDGAAIAARNGLMYFHQQLVSSFNGGRVPQQTTVTISGIAFGLLVEATSQRLEGLVRLLTDRDAKQEASLEIRSLVKIVAGGLKGFFKNGSRLNQASVDLVTRAVLEVNS